MENDLHTSFSLSSPSRTTDDTDETTDNTDPATLSPPEEARMGSVLSVHISEISDSDRLSAKLVFIPFSVDYTNNLP